MARQIIVVRQSKTKSRRILLLLLAICLLINNNAVLPAAWADPGASSGSAIKDPRTTTQATAIAAIPSLSSQSATSGSPLTVDNIKVEGNRLVETEDIMHVVKTKPGDKFDRDAVMQDLKAINNLGYFDERNLQVVPELNGSGVLLKIRVQENAPITQFAFSGNKVISSEEIAKTFTEQLSKPQNLSALSTAIDKVEQTYHERGYVLARVTDVKNDPDGTIGLTINEGEIEKIEISGNKKTKDFIIRQAIKIKPGTVYNEHQLTADLRKLYANGYFQDIRRSLVPSNDNTEKYILKVEVDEKRSGSVGLGGGIDTMAGPFGSFNIGDNNFRGRGESLTLNAQVGTGMFGSVSNTLNNGGAGFVPNQRTYQVQADYVVPNIANTGANMDVSGFGRDMGSFMIQQSMQRTLGGSVTFNKSLGHHFNASLGFIGENTSLRDVSSLFNSQNIMGGMMGSALSNGLASTPEQAYTLATGVRQNQLTGGTFATINPSVNYDTRDAAIDPTQGTLLRLNASPSLGLAAASFAKFGASASKFIKINESTTLATNLQAGTSVGNMPQFAQFYMGGYNGVRGYRSFTDLGTGTSMLMTTAELRTRIPFLHGSTNKVAKMVDQHFKAVFFFDAGQVNGNSLTNTLLSRSMLGASVGVGIRVKVPMLGMIRLDYGFPLISSVLGGFTPRLTVGFGEKF